MTILAVGLGSVGFYMASTWLQLQRALHPGRNDSRNKTLLLAALAASLQGFLLFGPWGAEHWQNFSFFNALSLNSWMIVILLLAVSVRHPVENLGICLFPLTGLMVLLSLFFNKTQGAPELSAEIRFHILFSVLAYGTMALAACQSVLVAIQNHKLHQHKPSGFIRTLAPLDTMEHVLFQLLGVAFVLLTLSLGSGFLYLEEAEHQPLAHKTLFSILAWFALITLLIGRQRYGWRGKTALRWTLAAFLLLALGYFGSKFVLELLLSK